MNWQQSLTQRARVLKAKFCLLESIVQMLRTDYVSVQEGLRSSIDVRKEWTIRSLIIWSKRFVHSLEHISEKKIISIPERKCFYTTSRNVLTFQSNSRNADHQFTKILFDRMDLGLFRQTNLDASTSGDCRNNTIQRQYRRKMSFRTFPTIPVS